jgi:O-methyltransferase
VLRVGAGTHETTAEALTQLCPKLSGGGYLLADDPTAAGRQAVDDYRRAHGLGDDIIPVHGSGVYQRLRPGRGAAGETGVRPRWSE